MIGILFLVFVFVLLSLVIAAVVRLQQVTRANEEAVQRILRSLEDFSPSHELLGLPARGLAIDQARQKIGLTFLHGSQFIYLSLPYSDLIDVECVPIVRSITETKKKGRATGAAVGGLIAGPLGAVIGSRGVHSRSTTQSVIEGATLKLTIKHPTVPVFAISVQNINMANVWLGHLRNVMHIGRRTESRM